MLCSFETRPKHASRFAVSTAALMYTALVSSCKASHGFTSVTGLFTRSLALAKVRNELCLETLAVFRNFSSSVCSGCCIQCTATV